MVPFLLPCATTGLSSIAAWDGSGTTPRGQQWSPCLNAAARTLRAERAVQGDVLSVWQAFHGTPSAPLISAHRVVRFGIVSKPVREPVDRLTLLQGLSRVHGRRKTAC